MDRDELGDLSRGVYVGSVFVSLSREPIDRLTNSFLLETRDTCEVIVIL